MARRFRSKRQHRWAFASGQEFAERWAVRGRYRRLPETKAEDAEVARAQAANTGAGATPANTGTPGKRTPSERARLAALARWGKYKGKGRQPKGGGRKPAQTPEQKEAARRQAAADNRAKVMAEFGSFGRQTLPDLEALAGGKELTPEAADGMVMAGLAERLSTGQVVLTANGRKLYNAASRGDVGAAKEAIDRAEAASGERIAKEKAKAEAEATAEKPAGGGGGGGSAKPSEDEKRKEQREKRAKTAAATAEAVGLARATLDTLRAAAEGEGVVDDALVALGLQGADGLSTDQGRRALTALERGDVRQYRAAIQDAQARLAREAEREERDAEREQARAEAERERAARDAERDAKRAERENARAARQRRMDRREALRVLGETQKMLAIKHGAHDQSTHGRRGGRGRASAGAYRAARAGGASVAEARAAARDVSEVYTARQRVANIDKQLSGQVSEGQRRSLEAEKQRLTQDIETRTARTPAARDVGSDVQPTVRGRGPKAQPPQAGLPPIPAAGGDRSLQPQRHREREAAREARQMARQQVLGQMPPPPPIVGSPKQQTFANDVRQRTLREAETQRRLFLEEGVRRGAQNLDVELAKFDAAIDRLRNTTDVRFWLDTARQTPVNTLLRTV